MGLFDGGFDMDALMQMLGPGAANAAGAPQMPPIGAGLAPDDQRASGIDALTRGMTGGQQPNLGPDLANPNPVAPGTVPLPTPNPLQPSPDQIAGAVRTGLPGPTGNPVIPGVSSPPADVGAALAAPLPQGPTPSGQTLDQASQGNAGTEVGGRAKTEEDKRPSLAQALKGVKAPEAPVQQKISSPNAPRPTTQIKGGDLQALLMALNAGVPALAGRQLPVTLGGGRG